jgi:hypothetical protein
MARRSFPRRGQTAAWAAAVRKAAMAIETSGPGKGRKRLDLLAERLVELALHGDGSSAMAALREIGDRLDGKPAPAMPPEAEDAPTKIIYTWSDPLDTLPASPPPAIGG